MNYEIGTAINIIFLLESLLNRILFNLINLILSQFIGAFQIGSIYILILIKYRVLLIGLSWIKEILFLSICIFRNRHTTRCVLSKQNQIVCLYIFYCKLFFHQFRYILSWESKYKRLHRPILLIRRIWTFF